jgi:hypothetical protein
MISMKRGHVANIKNLVLFKLTPEKVTFLNINSAQEPKSQTDHLYHLMD